MIVKETTEDIPLVSIIIPCFNAGSWIADAIENAISQSYPRIEVIVINDGSTDTSQDIINTYCDRVTTVVTKNIGGNNARNLGFNMSRGDFIQYLDADGLLAEDKIEKQVDILMKYNGCIVCCPTVFFPDGSDYSNHSPISNDLGLSGQKKTPIEFLKMLYGIENGYNQSMISSHAWLSPRYVIERAGLWDPSLTADQDGEFFCRVVLASGGVLSTPDTKVYYRKDTSNSVSCGRSLSHWVSRAKAQEVKISQLKLQVKNMNDRDHIDTVFAESFKQLAVSAYPEYKQFSDDMMDRVSQLGGTDYVPVLGGRVLEAIKHIFGWRVARQLSYFRSKFRKNMVPGRK